MFVKAGMISTIRIATMAMTTNNSSNVKAPSRSRCELEIKKQEVEDLETGERKPETGERKLDSNVKAPERSRCLSLKLRRSQGNTNSRIQYRLAIVNLE